MKETLQVAGIFLGYIVTGVVAALFLYKLDSIPFNNISMLYIALPLLIVTIFLTYLWSRSEQRPGQINIVQDLLMVLVYFTWLRLIGEFIKRFDPITQRVIIILLFLAAIAALLYESRRRDQRITRGIYIWVIIIGLLLCFNVYELINKVWLR